MLDTPEENQQQGIIRILPQEVIDRIKAGEVVQRPASAVKELLENALDAGSTEIVVTVTGRNFHKLTVSDNGCGISRADLPAAVQRHATSKLHTADDLQQLTTFGFRGEALASIAAVSHLSIVSRTANSTVAYQYSHDVAQQQHQQQPKPCARSPGTTVTIQNLFHNLPQRQRKINSSEYMHVLHVVQHYAIHYAASGVAFVCQQQGSGGSSGSKQQRDKVDLNTRPAAKRLQQRQKQVHVIGNQKDYALQEEQFEATKQVITQIYGAQVASCLLRFSSKLDESDRPAANVASAPVRKRSAKKKSTAQTYNGYDINNSDDDDDHYFHQLEATHPTYTCQGYVTNPAFAGSNNGATSSNNKRTTLILFCNHRLIECPPLKRRLEDLYTNRFRCLNSNSNKPWILLSLQVPPQHVDVNVHPTKQQITLLHFDAIVQHLTCQLQSLLASQGQSFVASAVTAKAPAVEPNNMIDKKKNGDANNDYNERAGGKHTQQKTQTTSSKILQNPYKRPASTRDEENNDQNKSSASSQNDAHPPLSSENAEKPKAIAPNKKIRTSRSTPTGALEPFLVSTQSLSQQQTQSSAGSSKNNTPLTQQTPWTQDSATSSDSPADVSETSTQHQPDCPFLLLSQSSPALLPDLSQPGAFATVAAQCTCRRQTVSEPDAFDLRLPRRALIRPRKVIPTQCSYTSINQLRKRIQKKAWAEMKIKLRSACFVGVASHQRSLIQCDKELILMNHFECAKELFYQLALYRFCGGAQTARLDHSTENGHSEFSGIDVATVIADCVQVEELLQHMNEDSSSCSLSSSAAESPKTVMNTSDLSTKPIKISETNQVLANQAAECLLERAEMLEEYFSICFKKDEKTNRIMLTGLPVLLEDFQPLPDGLPLFLLRLATEVDWVEEKPCFHDICRELGAYYAQLPHNEERLGNFIRHVLFPAITTLLVPAERMKDDVFVTLTDLQKLYRVFERC